MNSLKDLINVFGKDKINTFTKYPSILTLHCLGEKGKLTNELTTNIDGEFFTASEKIDGTNTRIITWGKEYLIGSRENILHYSGDLYFDPAQSIVEGLRSLNIKIPETDNFTVIYGEFYGGKVTANSKQYGQDAIGFRVFDIAVYGSMKEFAWVLEKSLPEISSWRERETKEGIVYGQQFLTRKSIEVFKNIRELNFDLVPEIPFELGNDFRHATILEKMALSLPKTKVALTDKALGFPEGLVLRNEKRTKILKLRFEDYEKTLSIKNIQKGNLYLEQLRKSAQTPSVSMQNFTK